MRAGAMDDILRAAGVIAETQRGQHAPFRNVETVALAILAGKLGADFGCQPVQAKWNELKEIERGIAC